jgi:preprotein translocase subunit SecF
MLSGGIILAGIISLIIKGLALGLDFTGGTELVVRFPRPVAIEELRAIMDRSGGSFEVKSFGVGTDWIVRTNKQGVGQQVANEITSILNKEFNNGIQVLQVNRVEAKIGAEIRRDAVISIVLSLIGIMIYVAFRFKFVFGVGAVLSLTHDVLITLGLVSIFTGVIPGVNLEFDMSMIAAFLTLIGYSVNDTVVVFDRVRENLRLFKTMEFMPVINKSVNTTMSRTILTVFTTFITMVALLFFGGEPTRGFAFTMVIGLLTGTYSSIWVASAFTLDWVLARKTKVTF